MNEEVRVRVGSSLTLGTIGAIVGIILCILQGVGTIDIGWFWATFPLWIVPAFDLALVILIFIVVGIIAFIKYLKGDFD